MCTKPDEIIERYKMVCLNEVRACEFIKAFPRMTIGGKEVGPFEVGHQANLPNWIIERLLVEGIVVLSSEDSYDSMARLQTLYREESNHSKLADFPPLLYAALNKKIHRLQMDKTSLDPRSHEDIERVERILQVMIETRLSKLLRVAKSGAYQEKRKQMTFEERWLCEEIVNLLSSWRQGNLGSL